MCTICRHPDRLEIERDLLAWPSVAAVAAHHRLPLEEARQHQAHLAERVEQARQQVKQLLLTDSLARLNLLLEKTMHVLAAAETQGDQKLMLQASREAGKLTKLFHSLAPDQEAATVFLAAVSEDWVKAASSLAISPAVRESVHRAIQQSLLSPCPDSHLEDELVSPEAAPPPQSVPAARSGRTWKRRLQDAVTTWPASLKDASTSSDSSTAKGCSRAGPG